MLLANKWVLTWDSSPLATFDPLAVRDALWSHFRWLAVPSVTLKLFVAELVRWTRCIRHDELRLPARNHETFLHFVLVWVSEFWLFITSFWNAFKSFDQKIKFFSLEDCTFCMFDDQMLEITRWPLWLLQIRLKIGKESQIHTNLNSTELEPRTTYRWRELVLCGHCDTDIKKFTSHVVLVVGTLCNAHCRLQRSATFPPGCQQSARCLRWFCTREKHVLTDDFQGLQKGRTNSCWC